MYLLYFWNIYFIMHFMVGMVILSLIWNGMHVNFKGVLLI